jgi:hypothetical protein
MYQRLLSVDKPMGRVTFANFVNRDDAERHPNLNADLCDCLELAGCVDTMPFLSEQAARVVRDPGRMFPNGVESCKKVTFTGGKRLEYVKLIARHLRNKQCGLRAHVSANASVFAVSKAGKNKQRVVWNGSVLSSCAVLPPKPPLLISPTSLAHLEANSCHPIWVSKKDGSCFFDQLALLEQLQEYMGRPSVTVTELMKIGCFSREEVLAYLPDEERSTDAVTLYPVNLTWAMGYSWSSYVAQSVMTGCCKLAGATNDMFLADAHQVPESMDCVIGVATDDVMHFSSRGAFAGDQWMSALEDVFEKHGVLSNAAKDVAGSLNATCVGIDITQGIFLGPSASKLFDLIAAAADLFINPSCSAKDLASFTGTLQWFDLLNRWLLSCLHQVYMFNRASDQSTMRAVPRDVQSELMLNLALLPLCEVDLRRQWLDKVVATDASPSYGFGVSVCHCPRSVTRTVGRASLNSDTVVRMTFDADDPAEKPRAGNTIRLPVKQKQFRTVLSRKADYIDHSGGLEAHGLCLGIQWLARKSEHHASRAVILVDAKAVLGAARKGRTSAPTLRNPLRRCAATALASDILVHLAYTPSESNAADWPSRGLCRRKALNRHKNVILRRDGKVIKYKRSRLEISLDNYKRKAEWLHRWCVEHGLANSVGGTVEEDSSNVSFSAPCGSSSPEASCSSFRSSPDEVW